MKINRIFSLVALCFLLALTACQSSQDPAPEPATPAPEVTEPEAPAPEPEPEAEPELSQRAQDWNADLDFLSRSYKSIHKDPFYLVSEEEFDWRVEQLRAKVDQLSDEDMVFEIIALMAGVGDIHTCANLPISLYERQFPIRAKYLGDKIYLTDYQKGYEQFAPYLLHEVVSVNGVDITYIEEKAASLNNPFNRWYSKEYWGIYFLPAFFDWAGCDYKEGYTFEFLNDNQEVESVEVPVIPFAELTSDWVNHENWDQLLYRKSGNRAEYVEGENGGYVYLSLFELSSALDGQRDLQTPFDTSIALLTEHPDCSKLVIDIRSLPGGSASMFPWVEKYVQNLKDLSIKHIYVATSGYSASSAIFCMALFKNNLGATIIGEPTGQFTSFFAGASVDSVLPHSKISLSISNKWYEPGTIGEEYYDEDGKLYPWESTVLPDVYVYQDIDDIRQGKDSVLEWVLVQ